MIKIKKREVLYQNLNHSLSMFYKILPKYMLNIKYFLAFSAFSISIGIAAQLPAPEKGFSFTEVKKIPSTPVKNQYNTGTCWSFAAVSLLESELIKNGNGEFDLSEMYFVRQAYIGKAINYVRMHGKNSFSNGGIVADIPRLIGMNGLLPDEIYPGKRPGEAILVQDEMDNVLKNYVSAIVENKGEKLTPDWLKGFQGILDAYLGIVPEKFTFNGKSYSPKSFADELGINPNDYVFISSFTHHPFYQKFVLEVPDNWNFDEAINLPLNEMMLVIDNAIYSGFSFAWACDITERSFSNHEGLAIVPEKDGGEISNIFKVPAREKEIEQETRQIEFDNYQTQDDHAMHIIGISKGPIGQKYYLAKNSWGTEGNPNKGYIYISEAYMKSKTIAILLNKNAIPEDIRKKMGI
jgi:bleomycin hydrolase